MDRERARARIFILLVDWILPFPLTAALYFLWAAREGAPFAAYTLALGLAFGYVVPAIGTNLLGLWRFNGPFRAGEYFFHHGFLYAPYLSLTLYVTWGLRGALGAGGVAAVAVAAAVVQAFLSCLHDIQGVRSGAIEIFNAKAEAGRSPEAIVLDYGPIGFALFGASYAACCLFAHEALPRAATPATFAALVAAGVTIMGATGIPYIVKERRFIGAARRTPRRAKPGA